MSAISLADVDGRALFPLSTLLSSASLPEDLPFAPGDGTAFLDRILFTDAAFRASGQGFHARLVVVVDSGLDFAPLGETLHLTLGMNGGMSAFPVEMTVLREGSTPKFRLGFGPVPLSLWVSGLILRPVKPGTREPDEKRINTEILLGNVGVRFSSDPAEGVTITGAVQIDVPRCLVGTTGALLEAQNVLLRLSPSVELPDSANATALPPDWRGIYFGAIKFWLPDALSSVAPAQIDLTDCYLGTGGVSGGVALDWAPAFAANLFGITIGLKHLGVTLALNQLTQLDLHGFLTIPALTDAGGNPSPIRFIVEGANAGYRILGGDLPPLKLGGLLLDLDHLAIGFDANSLKNVDIGGQLRIPGLKQSDGSEAQVQFSIGYAADVFTVEAAAFPALDLGPFALTVNHLDASFDHTGLRSSGLAAILTIPGLEAKAGGPANIGIAIDVGADAFALSVTALPPLRLGAIDITIDRFSLSFGANRPLATDIAGTLTLPDAKDAAGLPVVIAFELMADPNLLRIATTTVPAFEIAGVKLQLTAFSIGFNAQGVVASATTIAGTMRVPAFKDAAGAPLDVAVAVDLSDGFLVTAQVPGSGLTVVDLSGTVRLALHKLSVGTTAAGVRLGIAGEIDNRLALPVVDKLLPSKIKVNDFSFQSPDKVNLDVALTWPNGLSAGSNGNGGFELDVPIGTVGAGLSVTSIHLAFLDAGTAYEFAIAFRGATLELGPVIGVVDGLGLGATIKPLASGGNLGPLQVDLHVIPPTGIGLSLKSGPVKGGGYLFIDLDAGQYAGILQLEFSQIAIKAIGLLNTKMPDGSQGFSLLIIITVEFSPIQLGYGFTLNGVGGLIGVNRDMLLEPLRAGVKNRTLDSILFPKDPVANAKRIIGDLKAVFPPAQGRFAFGLMAKLGWGASIITAELGIIIVLLEPVRLAIIGKIALVLPEDNEEAIVRLKLDVLGSVDFSKGDLGIDASIYDSRIAIFDIAGDMALRVCWGASPAFAFAVGGFHPQFPVPPGFPTLRHISLSLATSDNPLIRLETYLALTANSVQIGAKIEIHAEFSLLGTWSVDAFMGFDALIYFSPFHFTVDVYGGAALKHNGKPFLALDLRLSVSGPGLWVVQGHATFDFFGHHSVEIDRTFGNPEPTAPPALADPVAELKAALEETRNWSAQLPDGGNTLVSLRQIEAPDLVLMHPLGRMTVTERVLPLGVGITHFGAAQIGETRSVDIGTVRIGSQTAAVAAQNVSGATSLREKFAPGQFFDLTEEQKLAGPEFEALPSGLAGIGSNQTAWGAAQSATFDYETIVIDTLQAQPSRVTDLYRPREQIALSLARASAAGRAPARNQGAAAFRGSSQGIEVREPKYCVVSTDEMARASGTGQFASRTEARLAMEQRAVDEGVQIVGAHEEMV